MNFQMKRFGMKATALLALTLGFPSLVSAASLPGRALTLTFTTPDSYVISGKYHQPSTLQKYTFILLHGLGSTKEEWQQFEQKLVNDGYGYFAYDARGHGESARTIKGGTVRYDSFGTPGPGSPWEMMTDDLSRAIRLLTREHHLRHEKLILAGASLGANVCLVYAASDQVIPAVIALSPGMDYAGVRPLDSAAQLAGKHIALVAYPGDSYAFQSCQRIFDRLQIQNHVVFIEGEKGHGVQMFNNKLESRLLRWVRQ